MFSLLQKESAIQYPVHNKEHARIEVKPELLEILAEADEDVKNGRVAPIQDTFADLRNSLKTSQH